MQTNPTTQTQGTYDLLDAFEEDGCPICRLGLHSVAHYIESINYDSVGDQGIRTQLQKSLGYCNLHAYQWLQAAVILGTANIYRDVVRVIHDDLQTRSHHAHALGDRVLSLFGDRSADEEAEDLIVPSASCPICVVLAETEQRLVKTLIHGLADAGFRSAYDASSGLCIPHLRLALLSAATQASYETLKAHALRTEETLIAQLSEIIRRHDYRYMHEPSGEEKGAAARAVAHVAGAKGLTTHRVVG